MYNFHNIMLEILQIEIIEILSRNRGWVGSTHYVGSQHGSIVGLEPCKRLSSGEALKNFLLEKIHLISRSSHVINLSSS